MIILVGRPNVGKSTLFNRLCGLSQAITSPVAGTTINRKDGLCHWLGKTIAVSDLVGLPISKTTPDYASVMRQVDTAFAMADAFLLVIDAKEGLQPDDYQLLALLRKTGKPVNLVVNKVDNDRLSFSDTLPGVTNIFLISALHGRGLSELLDYMLPFAKQDNELSGHRFVFVGRQNVGKSTLFNALLKSERSITSEIGGTTKDTVEAQAYIGKTPITLIDTAGIRRRGKVSPGIEKDAVAKALITVAASSGVICVIDAVEGPSRQDAHIIDFAVKNRKPVLIVLNKWDLLDKNSVDVKKGDVATKMIVKRFPWLGKFPIVPISALEDWNTNIVLNWMRVESGKRGV